jgi:hypothetical protein
MGRRDSYHDERRLASELFNAFSVAGILWILLPRVLPWAELLNAFGVVNPHFLGRLRFALSLIRAYPCKSAANFAFCLLPFLFASIRVNLRPIC